MPYIALFLEHRSMEASTVGLVLGAMGGIRIVSGPGWSYWADHSGRPRWLLAASLWGGALFCALAVLPLPLAALGATLVLTSALRAPAASLLDSEIVRSIEHMGLPPLTYGRIRLWGSAGFMVFAFVGGLLADDHIDWLVGLGAGIWAVAGILLGLAPATPVPAKRASPAQALAALARDPVLRSVLLASVLYGTALFSYDSLYALHLNALGHASVWTGAGVAVGVVAEIALMASPAALFRRFSALEVLLLAGGASVLRYALTAFVEDPLLLSAIQGLHALGFGAWWLSSMELVRTRVPAEVRATALALLTTAGWGVGPMLAGGIAAVVMGSFGTSGVYLLSALISAVGIAVVAWGDRVQRRAVAA